MSICRSSEQYLTGERYRQARKRARGKILDEFVETTGCHRKPAIALLRCQRCHRNPKVPIQSLRRGPHLSEDKWAALWLPELVDQIGSKRLRAAMTVELDRLRCQNHIDESAVCFNQIGSISPSTMDRFRLKGRPTPRQRRGSTKPGTLLKHESRSAPLPMDDKRPGFEEINLCNMMREIEAVSSPAPSM